MGRAAEKHKRSRGGARASHAAPETGQQWVHFPFPHERHAPHPGGTCAVTSRAGGRVNQPACKRLEEHCQDTAFLMWALLRREQWAPTATPPSHRSEESGGKVTAFSAVSARFPYQHQHLVCALQHFLHRAAKHLWSNKAVSSKWSETFLSLNQNQQS